MAYAVICRPATGQNDGPWSVHARFGVDNSTVTGLSPSTSVLPCQYRSTKDPYSSLPASCCYRDAKRTKPGNLQRPVLFRTLGSTEQKSVSWSSNDVSARLARRLCYSTGPQRQTASAQANRYTSCLACTDRYVTRQERLLLLLISAPQLRQSAVCSSRTEHMCVCAAACQISAVQ
jgi:hypothetical protein